jgi:uncharacterized membrane protein YphA (DoxX/SURF4 family)
VPIYVEIQIKAPLEEVWRLTQVPELHERWDLRFTTIQYLPLQAGEAQQFLYATRIGLGLRFEGRGETRGERSDNGTAASALKFWSNDPKSLIAEGSGYWKYISRTNGTTTFLTCYDYRTRFGVLGNVMDSLAFRPLIGWATAWSFDSMRLWLEEGVPPESQRRSALAHLVGRISLGFVWIYMGLVPKLLYHETGELAIMRRAALPFLSPETWVTIVGALEILFGLAILGFWRSRWPLLAQVVMLIPLTVGAFVSTPDLFIQPFNPVTLNVSIVGLAVMALLSLKQLPSASHCLRKPKRESS